MKWINTRAYVYILYLQVYVQHVQNVKLLISQMEKNKKQICCYLIPQVS